MGVKHWCGFECFDHVLTQLNALHTEKYTVSGT
jgi:hypothetical protein